MCLGLREHGAGAFDQFAVGLFRFDHHHNHVHEAGEARRDAELVHRGHVEDDIVEVARFELGDQAGETLGQVA